MAVIERGYMIALLGQLYISILPTVIAATVSTVVVRRPIFRALRAPIDGGYIAKDGKRLFGDNKTWLGLVSLVVLSALAMGVWGAICAANPGLQDSNWFYRTYENTVAYNLIVGALMGLGYALAELPNSYLKRRQGIKAGATIAGWRGVPNIVLDHTDSIIGCAVVMAIACPLTVSEFFAVIIIGAITHLLVNVLLVVVKVKKNI